MRVAPSFVHLYIQTLPKFETLAKLKSTNNILLIYILVLTYPHFSSAFCSFFVRSLFVLCSFFVRSLFVLCSFFVRLLFVFCSSFVRLLFVFCSSFVRLLFVFCSSFVRLLFVFCSSFVRLLFVFCSSFVRLTFPLLHSLSLGEGWGEDILFVFCSSARVAHTARRATTSHFTFYLQQLVLLALLAL
ncbi:hypothetical protein Coch_2123 [Capnocytophaga ochracea DSM 7271]|uniref:Uncharacterized protein n=1 Tax=Capnocytophaga ochracea (strain ATCC 27872 / DSM 7271 / CCUG 9716 / JCM 12966 / NCTC 12371 / SS31 / VPI 2845) TaxID=521097 RepID=C7M3P1_CAPOD|nr:hypothetical protein Coch_2123 [Capnocytophaga ochracea DSM 7271]